MENIKLHQAISRLKFALERASNQLLIDECGWGSSHFRLLIVVAHDPEADQTAIARTLGQTEAAVSRQLKLLIDNNLVVQKTNPDNRRQNQLIISPFGRQELSKAQSLMKKNFNSIFADLDSEIIEQTLKLISQITEKIELANESNNKGVSKSE